MTHQEILTDLKNKVYHPVYFLSGEETYYTDLIADFIEKNVLETHEKDFNQSVLYGKDTDMVTILSEAKRFPMMANHNVVIVKEAQHLTRELSKLEPYLDNLNPSTLLVFCYKHKALDGRKAIAKKLKKEVVFLESKKLYENQIPQWVTKHLKSKGYDIQPAAAMLVSESLGTDLSKIINELNKLTLNVPQGNTIDAQIVEENIGISKDFNNYELNKALGSRNIGRANQIIHYFSKNEKNHPLVVTISVLYSFFTNVLKYHYTKDKTKNNLAAVLRINPFFVSEYQTASRNYSIKECVKIIEHLKVYDLKSKGVNNASASTSELTKELIFNILH